MLYQTCLAEIPSLFVVNDNEAPPPLLTTTSPIRECFQHPYSLVVVTRGDTSNNKMSNISGSNTYSSNKDNYLDRCVWLAKLITRYTDSIHILQTPLLERGDITLVIPKTYDEGEDSRHRIPSKL